MCSSAIVNSYTAISEVSNLIGIKGMLIKPDES